MPRWLKSKSEAKRPGLSNDSSIQSLRYAVLDTELTSLDHRTNRLLSIGAIIMEGPSIQLGEQFYKVVNPQVSIPAETVVIHKLRMEDVNEGEAMEPVLNDFNRFVAGALLVGHFLDIDLKILGKEMLKRMLDELKGIVKGFAPDQQAVQTITVALPPPANSSGQSMGGAGSSTTLAPWIHTSGPEGREISLSP